MKMPLKPPIIDDLTSALLDRQDRGKINTIFSGGIGPAPGEKYHHWDKLKYLTPPKGFSHEDWWLGIKVARQALYRPLPLVDKHANPFYYAPLDLLYQQLHEIDIHAGGAFRGSSSLNTPGIKDAFYIKSLLEEAITSSQLEGAATTRMVAKEMLLTGRRPRDLHEQMIYNNYQAMTFIRRLGQAPLSREIILELQSILTQDAVEDPTVPGRLRKPEEPVKVYDDTDGLVLHDPPRAEELDERIQRLCEFANAQESKPFMHPVLRAIILHFQLAYDHPFVDGNGRTARALFYWSMARQKYRLCEYLSISSILRKAPAQYGRSFLYTETDDNDMTYFILFHLRVIQRAIDKLHQNLEKESQKLMQTEMLLRESKRIRALNYRQIAIIEHALRHPHHHYTFASHKRSNHLSYQTARTDLLQLSELQLFDLHKQGRVFVFVAPGDLQERIKQV